MVPLLAEIENGKESLGVRDLTVERLLTYLRTELSSPYPDPSNLEHGRSLDSFIEAQVHGTVDLGVDVERLVADPAFRGTMTEEHLKAICSKYNIPLYWHPGFSLHVNPSLMTFVGLQCRLWHVVLLVMTFSMSP